MLNATFSADGSRLATLTKDGVVRVWDIATARVILKLPIGSALPVAFHIDGTRLAILSEESRAPEIWDISTAEEEAPKWLPDLAEAIAGCRLDTVGAVVRIAKRQSELERATGLIAGESESKSFGHWGTWLTTPIERRSRSPFVSLPREEE